MTNSISHSSRFLLRPNRLTRPVAILLALLLGMPAAEWLTAPSGSHSVFFAEAQSSSCPPSANRIIQNFCVSQIQSLIQFESDAVQTYLAEHGLPASDSSLIYQYGRTDLRAEVRAMMMNLIVAAADKKPADRTSIESNVLAWLVPQLQQAEMKYYGMANTEYQKWLASPCNYILDADIAASQNLNYNRFEYCYGNIGQFFSSPDTPTLDYFLAVGWKASYGSKLSQTPQATSALLAMQQQRLRIAAASAFPAGIAVGGTAAAGVVANVNTLFPFTNRVAWVASNPSSATTTPSAATNFVGDAAAESVETVGEAVPEATAALEAAEGATEAASFSAIGASAASVVAVLVFAIETAVIAGINVVNQDETKAALATLPGLAAAANATPDIATFIQNAEGLTKLDTIFLANTLPDYPSTASLSSLALVPVSFYDFNAKQVIGSFAFNSPNANLVAQAKGGWFVLSGTTNKGTDAGSLTPTIDYFDWNGVERYASRIGPASFLIEKAHPTGGESICQGTASANGSAASSSLAHCLSYVSNVLQISPGAGRPNLNLEVIVPQTFTSANRVDFTPTTAKTFPVTLSPAVNDVVCQVRQTGSLPNGISYTLASGTFSSTAGLAATGIFPQTLTEYCQGTPFLSQTLTLNVATPLAITSPATITYPIGEQFTFNFTTTGAPAPKLTFSGVVPLGTTFKDNGDGTATITGRPTPFVDGCLQISGQPPTPCDVLTADNGVQKVTQVVTIGSTANFTSLHIVSPLNADGSGTTLNFPLGQTTSYNVQTAGGLPPISIFMQYLSDPPISWLTFKDNHDGTGVVSGSPAAFDTNAPGIVATVAIRPIWCCEIAHLDPSYAINLTKPQPDFVTSPYPLIFLAGASFPHGLLQSNSYPTGGVGSITATGPLPGGLAISPDTNVCLVAHCNILANITGPPTANSGGLYHVPFQISGNWGTAIKNADILIYQAPKILGTGVIIFNAGTPGLKTVNASGYPLSPIGPLSNGLGSSPGIGFSIATGSGLPASVTMTSGIGGVSNGSATFAYNGDKTAIGLHSLYVQAKLGPVRFPGESATLTQLDQQLISIYIVPPGDVNLDFKVDCSDLNAIKASLNKVVGQTGYNPALDVNNDGIINIKDLSYVAQHMPAGTVCQ